MTARAVITELVPGRNRAKLRTTCTVGNTVVIEGEADVHFAHARGFIAKTSATDPDRLRELVAKAWIS